MSLIDDDKNNIKLYILLLFVIVKMSGMDLTNLLLKHYFKGIIYAGRLAGGLEIDVLKYDRENGIFVASGKNIFPYGTVNIAAIGTIEPVSETECDVRFNYTHFIGKEPEREENEEEFRPMRHNTTGVYIHEGKLLKLEEDIIMEGDYFLASDKYPGPEHKNQGKWKLEIKPGPDVSVMGWKDYATEHNFLE